MGVVGAHDDVLGTDPAGQLLEVVLVVGRHPHLAADGLDGVVAKRRDLPYLPGSRDGVVKVKPERTADAVVVGVRWKSKPERIATLLLGLYGDDGEIDYVGSAAVAPARHDEIAARVLPLLENAPERRFLERRLREVGADS